MTPALVFLLHAAIVVCLPYLLWSIPWVRRLMALVVVQMLAGVLLGPTVLGRLYPEVSAQLFDAGTLASSNGLSWLAVVLLTFQTGFHFDVVELSRRGRAFITVGLTSVAVPALLGALGGWAVYAFFPGAAGVNGSLTAFMFGMAIATGITALPILGAILMDLGLEKTAVARQSLGYALTNDGLLWVLMSILLTMTLAKGSLFTIAWTGIGGLLFLAAMIWLVRPILARLDRHRALTGDKPWRLPLIVGLLLLSSAYTQWIGLHYVFGAFILGAMVPHSMAEQFQRDLAPAIQYLLLPFYFMSVGMRTAFDLNGVEIFLICAIMCAATGVGKFVGTAVPARWFGASRREAAVLGSLMQAKGLIEIVVLTVLLDARIISTACFSGMVLMAIIMTLATKPLVLLAGGRKMGAWMAANPGAEGAKNR